jgi:peptidoglycan/LPS O-acetylase OafA/YrhL
MTQAEVGGPGSAAEPRGRERVAFPAFNGFRVLIVVFVATVLVSIASYLFVERPALSLKSRIPNRRPVAAPAG